MVAEAAPSIFELLTRGAAAATQAAPGPEAPAILAPGRAPLSWGGLLEQVRATAHALAAAGITHADRVALVLPNGPEAAVCFLGTAARAVAAPLNPAYRRAELEFYLDDLRAGAVIVGLGAGELAAEVARDRGIPVLSLSVAPGAAAGVFELDGPRSPAPDGALFADAHAPALVLHTSGTTARPKRVPLTQSALVASAENIARTLALGPADRGLELMPLFHIHGLVGALLAPLGAGGSVVCLGAFDAGEFFRALGTFAPTWYSAVPSMHRAILSLAPERRAERARAPLRFARSSSAALPAALMAALEAELGVPVIESYGMTEASHQVASNPLPPAPRKPGSVGRAAGPEVRVMTPEGGFAAVGEVGEIVLRGANVTLGYEGDPGAHASAFHQGWFRTGDQGYLDPDGYLFLTGRLKELINRGGEKIAPQEVDEALYQHPAVLEAVTFARPHPTLGEDVAAAVALKEGHTLEADVLRAFLAERLAEHKVPRSIHFVDTVPRGATGKLVRIGLAAKLGLVAEAPRDAGGGDGASATSRATGDPLERRIAALLGELLGGEATEADDDFFARGGDSALATAALARLHGLTGVEVSIATMLGAPTAAGLARAIRAAGGGALAAEPTLTLIPRADGPDDDVAPSLAQARLWFIEQLTPGSRAYARPLALRLVGPLDHARLGAALDAVFARHEVLRARFARVDGRPRLRVDAPRAVQLELHARGALGAEDALAAALATLADQVPDLERGSAGEPALFSLGDDDHLLALPIHHVAFDAGSAPLFVDDLVAAYDAAGEGRAPTWAPLPVRYRDFAAWQASTVAGEAGRALGARARIALAGAPAELELPYDRPRPAERDDVGARLEVRLAAEVTDALRALARREGTTLFIATFAAFAAFLARLTGAHDLVVGTPVSQRRRVELEGLVGLFVNTLVLRVSAEGDPSFRALLARAHTACAAAYELQDLPFERLVELLNPPRDPARTPLFNVMFQLRPREFERAAADGLVARELSFDRGVALVDLSVELVDRPDGLVCRFEYDRALFDAATVDAMARRFGALLAGAAREPELPLSALPMLGPAEREAVLAFGRGPRAPYPRDATIHGLFAAQVARAPERVAVVLDQVEWSYARLADEAARLRARLRAAGVAPGQRVGVWGARAPETIAAMLAVLEVGAAYVPLDPSYPEARLRGMATIVDAVCVDPRLAPCPVGRGVPSVPMAVGEGAADGARADVPPPASVPATACAHVLFTSGSTGEPRPVALAHRGVVQLLLSGGLPGLGPDAVMLQVATLAFDGATLEIWGALLHGARLVLHADELPSPRSVATLAARHGARTMLLTPSLFAAIVEDVPEALSGLRHLYVGGEVMPVDPVRRALARHPDLTIINLYGPTEATVAVTAYPVPRELPEGAPVPIGRPLPNVSAYVRDPAGGLVPIGVTGELQLGGDGLALEYLGRPEATRERFVDDPFAVGTAPADGERRLYRTGDLARWRADGVLEFVGRRDQQVKLRGFRIELGEVEQAARRVPGVRAAVAVVRERAPGDRHLELFVVPQQPDAPPTEAEVLADLRATLPPFMVPSACAVLERLPQLPNGKLDRAALARPPSAAGVTGQSGAPGRGRVFEAPADPSEAIIAELWARLLGVAAVGRTDDFFELGGHSLLAARMVDELERALGVRASLRAMFTDATLAAVARRLVDSRAPAADAIIEPVTLGAAAEVPGGKEPRTPFFFLHGDFNGGGFYACRLARALGPEQPFFVVHPVGLEQTGGPPTLDALAGRYVDMLLTLRPRGPFRLGGYCAHGLIAFEIARRLSARGVEVERLLVFGAEARNAWLGRAYGLADRLGVLPAVSARLERPLLAAEWLRREDRAVVHPSIPARLVTLARAVERGRRKADAERRGAPAAGSGAARGGSPAANDESYRLMGLYRRAMAAFVARSYPGAVDVIWPREDRRGADPTLGWGRVTARARIHEVPGSHLTSVTREWAALAEVFRAILA